MSQATTKVLPTDIIQFVEENTTLTANWCSGAEILYVFSWYGEAEREEVRDALDAAVEQGRLVSDKHRYTLPDFYES